MGAWWVAVAYYPRGLSLKPRLEQIPVILEDRGMLFTGRKINLNLDRKKDI